jgi:quercetin dioxygenase-like cupin family protein
MGTDVRLGAMDGVFTVAGVRPARDGMTISRDAGLGSENTVTFFALGAGTSISRERYDMTSMYIGALGEAVFLTGDDAGRQSFLDGDMLIVPGGTLCGVESGSGAVYTEIIIKKEINMNNLVKAGEVMKLKNLIQYEEGSISNIDIVSNPTMKFVLMAFDEGTGLQPHRAPGNAIIFALEGKAVIGYEGKDYTISAGENFRFEKNGLHSVTAAGKFKMALLLVIE